MDSLESFVVFKHENEEFVLQNEQIVLNRYYREFNGKKSVDFITKSNHNHVIMFFRFLQKSDVPEDFEDQIQVFQLLKEWDCYNSVLTSFLFIFQSQPKNGFISLQNRIYPVNIGCFYFHSSKFQEFYLSHPNEVFVIAREFSPKSFEVFLDLLHCGIPQTKFGDVDEVLELCNFFGCSSLCEFVNEKSPEYILSLIICKQEEESFDFSFYENVILENFVTFMLLPDFGHVCFPFLCRLFQRTECIFPISLLKSFFESCISFHGSISLCFLSKIRFQPWKSIEEHNQILSIFSKENTYGFFSLCSNHFREISEHFEQAQRTIRDLVSKNAEIENKQAQVVQELKDKEAQNQRRIEDLMKRLSEFEKYKQDIERRIKEDGEKRIREEEERKKREEIEAIRSGKWKSTKPSDFISNFFEAAKEGKLSSIIYLLANGTNVNTKDPLKENWHYSNCTALHYAAINGHVAVVEYLVNQKADINSKDISVLILFFIGLHFIMLLNMVI